MKLEHFAINVPNARALVDFFVANLGMKIVIENDTPPYMHFVSDGQGAMMEIYSNPVAPFPDYAAMHPSNLHIAFASDDIETDRANLLAAGAEALGEISDTPAGDRLAFFRGPDSVPFQLVQRKTPMP